MNNNNFTKIEDYTLYVFNFFKPYFKDIQKIFANYGLQVAAIDFLQVQHLQTSLSNIIDITIIHDFTSDKLINSIYETFSENDDDIKVIEICDKFAKELFANLVPNFVCNDKVAEIISKGYFMAQSDFCTMCVTDTDDITNIHIVEGDT